jgi:hypothetical protein
MGREQRRRRLPSFLADSHVSMNTAFVEECVDFALKDVQEAVHSDWDRLRGLCETHVGTLEDKGT